MAWLPLEYGRNPGEIAASAGMSVHGGAGHYPQQRNAFAEAIKGIAPGIAAYLKQKKQAEIAATLQSQDQPDTAMDDLQYERAYRQTYPEQFPQVQTNGKYPMQLPDGTTVNVTGNKAADMYMRRMRGNANEERAQHFSESAPRTSAADINREPPSDQPIDPSNLYQRAIQQPKVMGQETDSAADINKMPQGGTTDNDAVLRDARAAIAKGKDPNAVRKRLQEMGIDASGL